MIGLAFAWAAGWPLLLLAPVLWFAVRACERGRSERLQAITGRTPRLVAELAPGRRGRRRTLWAVGLGLALLALLQPRTGSAPRDDAAAPTDMVVCLDVSRSMLARDVVPSRLQRARADLAALAARVRGGRLGLVAFAGEAVLRAPLTRDMTTFAALLDGVDPLTVPRGGTDLGAALDRAFDALAGGAAETGEILLVTDGEDHGGRGLQAARRCAQAGVTVHCVPVGTRLGAKIAVPGPGAQTAASFVRDAAGDDVVTTADPAGLGAIAAATGGDRLDAVADVVAPSAGLAAGSEVAAGAFFQWPLMLALLLWVLELAWTDRRRVARGGGA